MQVLTDYDQKKGTDLLHSLEAHLDEAERQASRNLRCMRTRTAVLYRLQRIEEATRMDLDSGPVRLVLHLEMKVQALGRAQDQSWLNIEQSTPWGSPEGLHRHQAEQRIRNARCFLDPE